MFFRSRVLTTVVPDRAAKECMHVGTYIRTHPRMHAPTYDVHTCACMLMFVCVSLYVCVCLFSVLVCLCVVGRLVMLSFYVLKTTKTKTKTTTMKTSPSTTATATAPAAANPGYHSSYSIRLATPLPIKLQDQHPPKSRAPHSESRLTIAHDHTSRKKRRLPKQDASAALESHDDTQGQSPGDLPPLRHRRRRRSCNP